MTLFRLDASIRVEGSHSRAIGDLVEQAWLEANPGQEVTRRHLGTDPVPATAFAAAVSAAYVPEESWSEEQRSARALAAEFVDELVAADVLLFAVPIYNFGVSQHFKAWVDLVITDPRMGPGTTTLAGKPAELAVVRGGSYRAGTPREGWDHATAWMRRILEDVWGLELSVVETEFTLVGVNPALDEFTDIAAGWRAESEKLAREHGTLLGRPSTTGA